MCAQWIVTFVAKEGQVHSIVQKLSPKSRMNDMYNTISLQKLGALPTLSRCNGKSSRNLTGIKT